MLKRKRIRDCFLSSSILLTSFITSIVIAASSLGDDFDDFSKAITNGDANKVLQLLSTGISPNIHDNDGITPLIVASSKNKAEVIRILLKHGACQC